MNREELEGLKRDELEALAKERGLQKTSTLKKSELVEVLLFVEDPPSEEATPPPEGPVETTPEPIPERKVLGEGGTEYVVALPRLKPLHIMADSEDEAVETFKRYYGIIASDHQFECVEYVEKPQEEEE